MTQGLFNRYRAFRRARDVRCMLCAICCWMCISCNVDAIFGGIVGGLLGYLGQCWGHLGATLGPLWGSWGVLGSPLGFRVEGVKFDHQNAYLFEMLKSLSPYACAAKTPT